MLALLVANLIILPVTISFFNDDFSPRWVILFFSPRWVVFYVGSDAVLLLDVLINFRTGPPAPLTYFRIDTAILSKNRIENSNPDRPIDVSAVSNQLHLSFRQPHSVHCPPGSPHSAHIGIQCASQFTCYRDSLLESAKIYIS